MANNNRRRGGGGFGINLTGPGTIFTLAFIGLAVGMGVLLSRGVTPRSTLSDPGETGDLEIVKETPGINRNNLQLKTIKFRECASKVAVGLLVDRSGSMRGAKIDNLKSALTTFTQSLSDQSVIGLSSFSSNDDGAVVVQEDVPFSRYKDAKSSMPEAIQNLRAAGATNTRSAFLFERDKILAAQTTFPNQKFALIFLSDGIPETNPRDCASGRQYQTPTNLRCFANSQDPTQSPDVSKEIKDKGIKIYTIALYVPGDPQDEYFLPDMRTMMGKIATEPTLSTYYEIPDPTQLKQIYKDISHKICNDAGQ